VRIEKSLKNHEKATHSHPRKKEKSLEFQRIKDREETEFEFVTTVIYNRQSCMLGCIAE
jgi:hypothetical protein